MFASKHLPNVVYATSYQAALYKSTDYGATWDTVFGDWPENPAFNGLVNVFNTMFESPLNAGTLLLSMYSGAEANIQIARSDDGGAHWYEADSGICDSLPFTEIVEFHSHVTNDSLWFAGFTVSPYSSPSLVFSTNAGQTWQHPTYPYPYLPNNGGQITSSYKDCNVIYAGGQSGLSISTDYGLTWTQTCYHAEVIDTSFNCQALLSTPEPYPYTFASVEIYRHPILYFSPYFVRTYDHVHWDTLETVRDSFKVKCMASDPTHPATRIFAAGTHWLDNGEYHTVIESNDGGNTWQDIGPSIPFMEDDLNYFGDGMILTQDNLSVSLDGRYLYLSTTKMGIYRCELPPIGIAEEHHTIKPEYLNINIWPTPFNSSVSISAPEGARIEIFNINGRSVAEFDGGDQVWKPEASVGSGIYLVRARFDYFDKLNNRLTDRAGEEVTKRVVYLK